MKNPLKPLLNQGFRWEKEKVNHYAQPSGP